MTTYKSLLKEVKTLRKLASKQHKQKLISLLESGDMGSINQAIELNEVLGLLTDAEVTAYRLIPKIVGDRGTGNWWVQDGLGWESLKAVPNHPLWKKLTRLFASKGNLTSLPKEIGKLTNLTDLSLRYNNLTSLPKEIGNLKKLDVLGLLDNNLTSLPKEIGNLKNLRRLYLNGNNLTSLPKEIVNLKNLEELYLDNNNLTSLPKGLENLPNVYLRDNNLTRENVHPRFHHQVPPSEGGFWFSNP